MFALEEDSIFNVGMSGGPGDMSGGTFDAEICPLEDGMGCGTFALKYEDGTLTGTILAADLTPAEGMQVRVLPASRTLQPRPTDTTVVADAAGAYDLTAVLRDGDFIATILHDSVTAAGDSIWASMSWPTADTVDVEGAAAAVVANFTVVRMDTKIQGVVQNDRDGDDKALNPNEALEGVTINLYQDRDGDIELDTLIASTTTDATGAYEFSKLPEGTYAVQVTQVTSRVTLRKFTSLGVVVDTAIVHTMAAPALDTDDLQNVRRVGHLVPDPAPRWDFVNSTQLNGGPSHFTFLFSTGTATGEVLTAVGDTAVRLGQ